MPVGDAGAACSRVTSGFCSAIWSLDRFQPSHPRCPVAPRSPASTGEGARERKRDEFEAQGRGIWMWLGGADDQSAEDDVSPTPVVFGHPLSSIIPMLWSFTQRIMHHASCIIHRGSCVGDHSSGAIRRYRLVDVARLPFRALRALNAGRAGDTCGQEEVLERGAWTLDTGNMMASIFDTHDVFLWSALA